jgi:hypothetical protein
MYSNQKNYKKRSNLYCFPFKTAKKHKEKADNILTGLCI